MNRLACALVLSVACLGQLTADNIEKELNTLVTDVAAILEKENQTSIRIEKFVGKGDTPSHFGPEIQRVLTETFPRKNIIVDPRATIEIGGTYQMAVQDPKKPELDLAFIRINANLTNTKSGEPLAGMVALSRAIRGNPELGRVFAPTTSLTPNANRETRNKELRKAIENPTFFHDGSLVKSSAKSKFAVEVLVLDDAKGESPAHGAPIQVQNGNAFVSIKKGQSYQIKIHNHADFNVAVKVSIDGLDQFAFLDKDLRNSDGSPRFEYLVIPKNHAGIVKGWHRSLTKADAFTVDEYAKSASKELHASQGDVGVILVQFHAAWETNEQLEAEARGGNAEGTRGADLATRRGETVDQNLKLVNPHIGICRDQVSIRYQK